ncbi:MAG: pyridoxamine 5'-phosphate oxidase family protein [Rhodobacteraceae bacterium]|nr:pyridoxamine 5'-phosphate oxidase family protein [Paracoccaceae bacterium]
MSRLDEFREDPAHMLWQELGELRAGMLGITGAHDAMQPMSHFQDAAAGKLWFITSDETDLVRHVGTGDQAQFCVTSQDQSFFACLTGAIRQSTDRAKLDELWSPAAAAWFEGGRDNPHVCLLEMTLSEAALWASTGNPLAVGYEMLKANMASDTTPDVGEHVVIAFPHAA